MYYITTLKYTKRILYYNIKIY